MRLDGELAWKQTLANHQNGWSADRFQSRIMHIAHKPKFGIDRADRFFCIGSCFARNIEEHLTYRNIPVLSKRIVCPSEEWAARPTGIINKFTTASMLTELQWTLSGSPEPKD